MVNIKRAGKIAQPQIAQPIGSKLLSGIMQFDFWKIVLIVSIGAVAFFMIYPLSSLFTIGFQDAQTGAFTLAHFERFFTRPFFYNAFFRSMRVSSLTTVLAVLIGSSMAYLTTMYKVKRKRLVDILVIVSMLSPPFIGAYSWILMAGRNGYLARFARDVFGVHIPSIYGFGGIVLVMTLSTFPLIYLFTRGALKKVDASLSEAAESLGCGPIKKAATMMMPLITPTIFAAALLVFMDAFTDFGTPMLLGEGYIVMPVLVFNEFMSELGGRPNFAASLSIIMVALTAILFIVQKYVISKKSFTMSSLRPIQAKSLKGPANVLMHTYIYAIVALATVPQLFVIFTSFRATNGPMFAEGFSLDSYRRVFRTVGGAIQNTFVFGLIAIAIIIVLSLLIAYLTVRRKNAITGALDYAVMLPFVIPGSVIGITLILAFNGSPLLLIGTPAIMILAFVIRRLPYTLRSSSAILHQISPSIEEASISLGDSPMKSFFKVTAVMMIPGVVSGAILSWITIINELNASVLLFTTRTRTMSVVIYQEVLRASYGTSAALASILIFSTIASLALFFKLTGKADISL